MTKLIHIIFLTTLLSQINVGLTQPTLNERYGFNDETNVVFSSVISTDSCYYVDGIHTSAPGGINLKSSFTKFNFDGSIAIQKEIAHDTIGIGFWTTTEMIQTLDGNFAKMALAGGVESEGAFMFLKLSPDGDTVLTNYIYDFYIDRQEFAIKPYTLIQETDSTYYGVVSVQRESDLRAGAIFFKLDKKGQLLFDKPFYPPEELGYHLLRPGSMTKENDSVFVLGTTLIDVNEIEKEDERKHSKLIRVHKNGTFLNDFTYWDDTLSADVNGLLKTNDGGFLYGGRNGRHIAYSNGFRYVGRIIKLKNDYSVDWELNLGDSVGFEAINFHKILPLSDSEFVAVGFMRNITTKPYDQYGWLVKFDIHGQKIWERRHLKVPKFEGEANYPVHELFDAEITPDSGFIMVGNSFNFHENEFEIGQKGWLLKTDKYGCLVPGCQLNDNPVDTTDTIPVVEPITWIYPNPASTSIFYYHYQDEFKGGTAYIYNSQGQIVQKWEITDNSVTYEVDISNLATGSYIVKVFNMFGEPIETDRFIKY